jgi:hypothetical protein
MKKLNIILQIAAAAGFLMFTSCFNELSWTQTPTDKTPPPPVTNVRVESIPGGGMVKYDLPDTDTDISYVKVEYTYKGEKKVLRESIYRDSLLIEGFGSIEPVSANIYVVDHSENISTPVSFSFTPDTPPIETIFQSVQLSEDFGGILVAWTNETAMQIGITVFIEDSLGVFHEMDTKFSKEKNGKVAFRGLKPKETNFSVSLVDVWGNKSGSKNLTATPLFETLLDKKKFTTADLPGDLPTVDPKQPYTNFFDGSTTSLWVSINAALYPSFPYSCAVDFHQEARLSRFRLWAQPGLYYANFTFRIFEVWGTDELKTGMPDSYWTGENWKNDWVKLDDYELKRPSGNTEPISNPIGEDLEAALAGLEFIVPLEAPPCRYVRFIVHTIWSAGSGGLCMAEVSFWGDDGSNN